MKLGKLERVGLRDIWKTEDQDFTPWLAREDNLSVLADALNLDLELEAEEKDVGPFRADILCKDTDDGSWVLIENQLERTDHTHLGQLLTYAAGLQAVTVIWIAERFTDEHRAALDWLNEATESSIRFFGLEVEVWRIGDSEPAPKFNIVSKPNEWSRSVGRAARNIQTGDLSDTKKTYLEYWTRLREQLLNQSSIIKPQKPSPQHWATYRIGRSGFTLNATLNSQKSRIGVELFLQEDRDGGYIRALMEDREAIESELGFQLDWQELQGRKGSRIAVYLHDTDPTDRASWVDQMAWLQDHLEKMYRVLRHRVKTLQSMPSELAD